MKAVRQIATVLVFLVLGALAIRSQGSQETGGQKPSDTRQMRCVVKVTSDADVVPLSLDLVESLLRSDAVAGEAAHRTWPKGHGLSDAYLDVQPLGGSNLQDESASNVTPPGTMSAFPRETRTEVFGLQVRLDSDVAPAAKEFSNALIENLRAELQEAFTAYGESLRQQLAEAEVQQEATRREFHDLLRQSPSAVTEPIRQDPADEALQKQLDKIVDLSALTIQTPASEAFEILSHSVQPPLPIIVLWRDLFDNANIEPYSEVQFDGPARVRLGTALENMCSALTDPLAISDDYHIHYVVKGGAITVATCVGLPKRKMETRVYDLPPLLRAGNQAPELAALIRETLESERWADLCLESDDGTVTVSSDGRLVVCHSRDVHTKVQELIARLTADMSIVLPDETSQESLIERMESLLSYRSQLEEELNRLQERQGQLDRERGEEERRAMAETLRATANDLLAATVRLGEIRTKMAEHRFDGLENEDLQQLARIVEQCMNRCRKVLPARHDLGGEIIPFERNEKRTLADRIAAKQKDLSEVSRRIAEIQRVLAGSQTFDTEFDRVQWAARRCRQADARVRELRTRIANLRPCIVTVLGGTD